MSILNFGSGQKFKIVGVKLKGEIGKRLADMGFIKGVEAMVVRSALLGDPIQIKMNDSNVSLRKTEAQGIEVKLID